MNENQVYGQYKDKDKDNNNKERHKEDDNWEIKHVRFEKETENIKTSQEDN